MMDIVFKATANLVAYILAPLAMKQIIALLPGVFDKIPMNKQSLVMALSIEIIVFRYFGPSVWAMMSGYIEKVREEHQLLGRELQNLE